MSVEPHEHVTLDKDVFRAYQEIAEAAAYFLGDTTGTATLTGTVSLRGGLARLQVALSRSLADRIADPLHHLHN